MADSLSWLNTSGGFGTSFHASEFEKSTLPRESEPFSFETGIQHNQSHQEPEITLDLPKVERTSLGKLGADLKLKDIEIGGFGSPTGSSWLAQGSAAPTGKLAVYDQSTWNWPPPGGAAPNMHLNVLQKSPRLFDPTQSRNMDTHKTVETTNESSIVVIDKASSKLETSVLDRLDVAAQAEMGQLEMNRKQYNTKLSEIALLRRTVAGVMEGQVARREHQWKVKQKFYEADVESKRIFEEVQRRIKTETEKRMDEAKKEVAQQIQNAAQAAMDSTKLAIKERVHDQYDHAREKARCESAQLYAQQQQQKGVLRAEFVARLVDHKKALLRQEEEEAKEQAAQITRKNQLAEDFRVFALKHHHGQ